LPILAAPLRFGASYAVNPGENSYKSLLLRNFSSLAIFLSLTFKDNVHSVTNCQLCQACRCRKSVVAVLVNVNIAHDDVRTQRDQIPFLTTNNYVGWQ